jgi:hypothetical protein
MNYTLKQTLASLALLVAGVALGYLARQAWNAPCLTTFSASKMTVYRGDECTALLNRISGSSLGIDVGLRQAIDKNRGNAMMYGLGAGLCGLLVVGIFVWSRTRSADASPHESESGP